MNAQLCSKQPIPAREACIWQVDLLRAVDHDAEAVLAPDERERAARFFFDRDRRRFIAGRTALRVLLASHLSCTPGEVVLRLTEHGRPVCDALEGRLDFNLSNSEDIALIAFTTEMPVGIDIECFRSIRDAIELSERYFAPSETETLAALHEEERDRAFLTCWTRKEAVLKATGMGLQLDPVEILTGVLAQSMRVATSHGDFEISTFQIGANAIGTLATPTSLTRIHMHAYDSQIRKSV